MAAALSARPTLTHTRTCGGGLGHEVFHLASPEDGRRLGGHEMMAEVLELHEGRLVRNAANVGEPLDLHHYAPTSLSQLASRAAATTTSGAGGGARLQLHSARGRGPHTPAYWWHEVVSSAPPTADAHGGASANDDHRAGHRSVVALNWFTSRTTSASSQTARSTARRITSCLRSSSH